MKVVSSPSEGDCFGIVGLKCVEYGAMPRNDGNREAILTVIASHGLIVK